MDVAFDDDALQIAMPPEGRYVPALVAAVMSGATLGLVAVVMAEQLLLAVGVAAVIVAGFVIYGFRRPPDRFRMTATLEVPELAGDVRAWMDQVILRAVRIPSSELLSAPPSGVVVLEDEVIVEGRHIALSGEPVAIQHLEDNPPVHGLRVGQTEHWLTELPKLYWLTALLGALHRESGGQRM